MWIEGRDTPQISGTHCSGRPVFVMTNCLHEPAFTFLVPCLLGGEFGNRIMFVEGSITLCNPEVHEHLCIAWSRWFFTVVLTPGDVTR